MPFYVYILKCADDSYYTGSTNDISRRLWEHEQGSGATAYTNSRRPVQLIWSCEIASRLEALDFEHQIKGWSRAKKEALIRGDWNGIHEIVKNERKRREAEKRLTNKLHSLSGTMSESEK
jgi:predicted GIY-YIG superfamily endonuclease